MVDPYEFPTISNDGIDNGTIVGQAMLFGAWSGGSPHHNPIQGNPTTMRRESNYGTLCEAQNSNVVTVQATTIVGCRVNIMA
jgi:hypothetical protein